MPLVAADRTVAVVVQRGELIILVIRCVHAADHLETAQHAVAIPIEAREYRVAAIPFRALDAPVVVPVEIVEARVPGIVDLTAEKFRLAEGAVPITVDAPERLEIEMPFVRTDAAVAIVIEIIEAGRGPADIPLVSIRQVVGLLEVPVSEGADADLIPRELAVAIPVLILKRHDRSRATRRD